MLLVLVGSTLDAGATSIYELNSDLSFKFVRLLDDSSGSNHLVNVSWALLSDTVMFSTNETLGSVQMHRVLKENCNVSFEFCSSVSSAGRDTTHLALSPRGDLLVASNYSSGSLTVFNININVCTLEDHVQLVNHNVPNSGVTAHAHQFVFNGEVAYSCDLGNDLIYTYSISAAGQPLNLIGEYRVPEGSGPRHLVVSNSGMWAYVLMELSSEVLPVRIDQASRQLTDDDVMGLFSMLPDDQNCESMSGAAILLSADDRYLYVSNRDIGSGSSDRSSISVFAISSDGSSLTLKQTASSRGRHPRHMIMLETIDNGAVLLVANRDSQNFAAFPINAESGLLLEEAAVISHADGQSRDPGFLLRL